MTSRISPLFIVVTSFIFHDVSVVTGNGSFSNITCRETFVRNLLENQHLYCLSISSEQSWIKYIGIWLFLRHLHWTSNKV